MPINGDHDSRTFGKKHNIALGRAARALGPHQVGEAVAKVKAIIGPRNIPASEELAQKALDKLRAGIVPDADELTALEIVIRLLRPVVASQNGLFGDLPDRPDQNLQPQELKDRWSDFRTRAKSFAHSIGRVERIDGPNIVHVGTGFVVAPGVLMTNRHVLSVLTFGSEALPPGRARVSFKQELDTVHGRGDIVPILGILSIHKTLDIVQLEIADTARPTLQVAAARIGEGERIVTVGYPGEDPVNNPAFLAGVFGKKFGYKCAALGEVLDGVSAPSFYHDCSTTQGTSGSPVFSLNDATVVGVHRAGHFMYRNEAIDADAVRAYVGP
jgi:hypothetical protein